MKTKLFFISLGCVANLSWAAPAHEHGVANLNITLDEQGALVIELFSPMDNLVGFEHAPQNSQQEEALEQAYAQLQDGTTLFAPPVNANCTLQQVQVNMPYHNQEKSTAHAHDAHAHSDAQAQYNFQCAHGEALKSLNIGLFDAFPNTLRIRVQSAMPQQSSQTLIKGERDSVSF